MATFSKAHLSASAGGRAIKITTTATSGNLIHQTDTSSSTIDEVWLYATNTSPASILLTLEWGGATNPDDRIVASIPPQSTVTLIPGHVISGTGSASRDVRAFAGTANVINIFGYINRIS
jgi:hypothetical protein